MRQLIHAKKMELQQKLELVIMQNVGDEEKKDLAALAMVKKYSMLPYVPDVTVQLMMGNSRDRLQSCYCVIMDWRAAY